MYLKYLNTGQQPAEFFWRGQNDCNLLFYLSIKQVVGAFKILLANCPVFL